MPVARFDGTALTLFCPGCADIHRVPVNPGWAWNESLSRPTLHPSIAVHGVQWDYRSPFHRPNHDVPTRSPILCHSFVTDGCWIYLADSTHNLRSLTVPLPELPA